MSKENNRDHMTEASVVERPVEKVTREEMAIAIKAMKRKKAAGRSEVCAEMITALGEVGISIMMELCQRLSDGKGRQTSVLVPIFRERKCKK